MLKLFVFAAQCLEIFVALDRFIESLPKQERRKALREQTDEGKVLLELLFLLCDLAPWAYSLLIRKVILHPQPFCLIEENCKQRYGVWDDNLLPLSTIVQSSSFMPEGEICYLGGVGSILTYQILVGRELHICSLDLDYVSQEQKDYFSGFCVTRSLKLTAQQIL